MARKRLESIASRQRGYLFKDVLMAALAGLMLTLQVSVLSGASDALSRAPERLDTPSVTAQERAFLGPDTADEDQDDALATRTRTGTTPG